MCGNDKKSRLSLYKSLMDSIKVYRVAYGGFSSLARSPYIHAAILISIACGPIWWEDGKSIWGGLILSIMPSILGFTLGGYAILLAVGDDKFRRLIAGAQNENAVSPYMKVNGAFIHFIVVQTLCIVYALPCYSWKVSNSLLSYIGFFLFCYAILTALAAAFALLRLANSYDMVARLEKEKEKKGSE